MCGSKNKSGFTLLEILVVIAIMVMLGAIAVPNLRDKSPKQERKNFLAELNSLTSRAWFNGITKDAIQRIVFDFKNAIIRIEEKVSKSKDSDKDEDYRPLKRSHFNTSMAWPKQYLVKNFFIEGHDKAAQYSGGHFDKTWFYVMPNGLTQDVSVIILDKSTSKQGTLFKIILNPFSAQFKENNLQKSS